MFRRLPCCAAAVAALLCAQAALADRVAVLPARGGTDEAARAAAQAEIVRGLGALGHTPVAEAEVTGALWAVMDGVPDSAEEYRTVVTATKSDWALLGLVEPAVQTTRVELIAFHAPTGRVESVAREVERDQAGPQIQEMLAVLMRPEGIGMGELPWEGAAPPPTPPQPQQPQAPPQQPPFLMQAPAAPEPPPPEEEPAERVVALKYVTGVQRVWPPYSAGKPLTLSAITGFSFAAIRPEGATGTSVALTGAARLGYALGQNGNIEPFAQIGGNLTGPGAFWLEGGARYLFTPSVHRGARGLEGSAVHLGFEATLGAFIRPGEAQLAGPGGVAFERPTEVQPTLGAAAILVFGVSPGLQLEAQLGNLRWVPANEGALFLVGATAGAGLRF